MTKTVINMKISEKGMASISDSIGNSFSHDTGVVRIRCGGKEQDINMAAVAAISSNLSHKLAQPSSIDVPKQLAQAVAARASQLLLGAADGLAKAVDSFDSTVVLRDGLPSPLAGLCAEARQEKLIRDRR